MDRVHSYRLLAVTSLGLAACISSPEQPVPGDSLLALSGSLDLQGSQLEGQLTPALAFISDTGNELRVVNVPTQGMFPTSFIMNIAEPPPDDLLYALQDGEPELVYGYVTGAKSDHPTSLRIANGQTGQGGCTNDACVDENSWCSQDNEPANDVCYTETKTCDLNHENCTVAATGDVSLKDGPWGTLGGLSENYLVLYLSAPASAHTFTALAFAEGAPLGAGYHLLAVSTRSEAELEAASECSDHAQQLALDGYNKKHGTKLEDPVDLPRENEDEFDALFFGAQLKLRCPQTEKRYTPVADPEQKTLTIQLTRADDYLAL